MVGAHWVPRASEVIQIDFNPTQGHEQGELRPAIVLSNQGFNDRTSRVIVVPCTSVIKGYPFEVRVAGLAKPSAALVDQLRTLDWRARRAFNVGFASAAEMAEIRAKLTALLGL